MKKVLTVSIGRKSFVIDDDAFARLKNYLDDFRATIANPQEADEVMEDVEMRVAEILQEQLRNEMQSVNCAMVNVVIKQLGEPEVTAGAKNSKENQKKTRARKRLYRDVDNKMIGGVCSGVAAYFDIDVVFVRFIFLASLLFALTGFWCYVILWIVVPAARTVTEKLEMRGEPATAENIKNSR